ncbi:MAG TPA: type II toxin-antitoxin system VapC family toxin [Rhizomicrobium sp.]|nr:type II toxin-antitoxin system VapC family toxin [Rhizomicrobium sp.]
MFLVDVNILLYAHLKLSPHHERARNWLDDQLGGKARVGLPWLSLLGFLRIATNPRVLIRAESVPAAVAQVRQWLSCDMVWIPQPTERHADVLGRMLVEIDSGGDTVSDAHLAALAIEHGLTLCTNDRDFARFTGLRWTNPLDS